jgi:hypothetical protein
MDAATKCHQALGVGNLSMIRFAPLKTKMEPVFMARILMITPHKGEKNIPLFIFLSPLSTAISYWGSSHFFGCKYV